MSRSWLNFTSPVRRPSFASSGWAAGRPPHVGGVHHGLDLRAAVGDPIYAVAPGVVEIAARGSETAGNWIAIRHEGNLLTRYLHLTSIGVAEGQAVRLGQQIGTAGSTGFSSGPHLHFDAHAIDQAALSSYASIFGTPKGGFGSRSDFGWKVPAEPLIPVDKYDSDVASEALAYGIPLYGQVRGRGIGWGGILVAGAGLGALGLAVWYFTKSRAWV